MRMLFVTTASSTAYGFLLPFAKYERQRGHEVEFACSFQEFADAPSRVKDLLDAGFVVHEIPFAREIVPIEDAKAFWKLKRLIQTNGYDLVHTHTSKAGFIGRLAAKAVVCPIVIHTAHDFFFRAYKKGLKRQIFILLEKIAARFCDQMLFVSEAVRQEAINYHLKEHTELVLVGNGIDISKYANFQTDVFKIRSQYGVKPNDFWIGSIGRLVDNKGIDTFIKAAAIVFKQCPDARFIIAGDGDLRTELEQLADSLAIRSQIQFIGFLPEDKDVMDLMSSVDVFVLPTRREGLGMVYVEAMSLQCPVIGSRILPVTDVIKDGETGFLAEVDNPEAFATAILQLWKNPHLQKQMGRAGLAHVKQKFDLQQVFERIDAVYQTAEKISSSSQNDSKSIAWR